MICVVIKGPTFEEAHRQITKAMECADLIELRLDCFTEWDFIVLKNLRAQFSIPMIFTLRSQMQGGFYIGSEDERLADILRLAELNPEYLDLEKDVPLHFIEHITSQFPEIKLILSYHDFVETPTDLEGIYQEMRKVPAIYYKIAVAAKNCLNAFRLLCWAQKSDGKLIAIAMGLHGQVSRILGPIVGCPITYAALDEDQKSAPGQLAARTLIEQYHYRSLRSSKVYGLIGDPVDRSISDETHNSLIAASGLDAVYVKIQVSSSELPDFLHYARELPFHGLSVTMPLKEHILPFLDEIDPQAQEIGAVNTLLFKERRIYGFNTDGMGALNAIEKECRVKGKRIVIIGAGGAAKAIAYEAYRRGGLVTVVNRDEKKALEISRRFSCVGKGLDYMATCFEAGYDILINCTSVSQPIAAEHILPEAIVMDITTNPKETLFLALAKGKGCRVIYGYKMFVEQALGQFQLWFGNQIAISMSRDILEKRALDCVSGGNGV